MRTLELAIAPKPAPQPTHPTSSNKSRKSNKQAEEKTAKYSNSSNKLSSPNSELPLRLHPHRLHGIESNSGVGQLSHQQKYLPHPKCRRKHCGPLESSCQGHGFMAWLYDLDSKAWQLQLHIFRASKWLVQSGVGLHHEVCPEWFYTSKPETYAQGRLQKSASQASAEQIPQELLK